MIRLLNSAVMPVAGEYSMEEISQEEFASILQNEPFVSSIGYPQTADWIQQITGVEIPVSRDRTGVDDGDVLLIIRLSYRVDYRTKGGWQEEDWEYFRAFYRKGG